MDICSRIYLGMANGYGLRYLGCQVFEIQKDFSVVLTDFVISFFLSTSTPNITVKTKVRKCPFLLCRLTYVAA